MGRFSLLPNSFVAIWNINNVFDSKRMIFDTNTVELPWRSGSVMDCHATAPGSIPGRDGVFTELYVLRKGQ